MNFTDYQTEAEKTNIYPNKYLIDNLLCCCLGLASESGEVCGVVKKIIRDDLYQTHAVSTMDISTEKLNKLTKEIGDVLWYLSEICSNLMIPFEAAATLNLNKLKRRMENGVLGGSGDDR